jgi:hypothetical protein
MKVLDEHIIAQQCENLRQWRIPFRQIGWHLSARGALDENLIPVLQQLSKPTFFTHDKDFFEASLCHSHYAIVYLDVADTETAEFIWRVLRHRMFDTSAKRMGIVARAQVGGVQYWAKGKSPLQSAKWSD